MAPGSQMHLALLLRPTGHHQASWRHPGSQADAASNFPHYVDVIRSAERAKFDAFFLGDQLMVRRGDPRALRRVSQYMNNFEPTTMIAALAASTERIGVVATMSATYNEPYNVARTFASIDVLSGGRVGWNVVTSVAAEGPNYGREHPSHTERYERAEEFVRICKGLWDSFEDDAFLRDRETGVFTDLDKMHALDHHGEHFAVRGPLNSIRPIQGHPLIAQAGISPAGQQLAARHASMVFVTAQSPEDARELRRGIRERVAAAGRDPDHVKVLPGMVVLPAPTDAQAEAEHEHLHELIHVDVAIANLAMKTFADLSDLPLDEPLPESARPTTEDAKYFDAWHETGQREGLTLRELAYRAAVTGFTGFPVRGAPATIADTLEEWFAEGAADGFMIMPAVMPLAFDRFTAEVVPELQRRGLFRTEYEGSTLREHFGLPRPAWQPPRAAFA